MCGTELKQDFMPPAGILVLGRSREFSLSPETARAGSVAQQLQYSAKELR